MFLYLPLILLRSLSRNIESNPEIVDEILNDMVQSFEEEAEGVDVFADFMRFLEETYDDEDDDGLFS